MAPGADVLKTLIDDKVFALGQDAQWEQKNSNRNARGEVQSNSYDSAQTITIVPYNVISERHSFEQFGQLESGDTDAAVKRDVDIDVDDRVSFNGETYEVREIEDSPYKGENLVQIVRLHRIS